MLEDKNGKYWMSEQVDELSEYEIEELEMHVADEDQFQLCSRTGAKV